MARTLPLTDLSHLADFDEVIDVRSPSEYLLDHIPGAMSYPVLDDMQRAQIGTLYAQDSFEAKRLGASLIARNIARHIETAFVARPRTWRPLVYCWRGGTRSRAMAHILSEVGWRSQQLAGGYKAYRRQVNANLTEWPIQFRFVVLCGATGSGKSRVLEALEQLGAQVLDLEALAAHRGSVLGSLPDRAQPGQKWFESLIWQQLQRFAPHSPVFVEAESRKIGALQVPEALLQQMWRGECVFVEATVAERTRFLLAEYAHFLYDAEALCGKLDKLKVLHGAERIAHWQAQARSGAWQSLVEDLLVSHYDPAYRKSTLTNFIRAGQAVHLPANDLTTPGIAALARQMQSLACATTIAAA